MTLSNKLGYLVENVKRSSLRSSQLLHQYITTKRDIFLSKPVISTLNNRVQYLVSAENVEYVKMRLHERYHWVAGTEVTEVQERARELESKLNVKRKNMLEARTQMDNINERLREIVVELENTRRGDPKHLHLRQLEYDTIQEEIKVSKLVQKTQFEERETFTWLMNAVRESHETERNYNQRIKMLSIIGAAIGPFIGYMFSARLNQMRFRRMEEIINRKLELLSFTTINAIREIHGLDPEVMGDGEKQGLIAMILNIFFTIQSLLIDAFNTAVSASTNLLQSISEEAEEGDVTPEVVTSVTTEVDEKKDQVVVDKVVKSNDTDDTVAVTEKLEVPEEKKDVNITKPPTRDVSTQVTAQVQNIAPTPVERIIVEKLIPQKVDYANLPEFKSLMSSLKALEEKQDNLKQLLLTSQELQESNKIEVSVNSSDEEIVTMLQADQQMVRKILLSVSDLLNDSRTSLGVTLDTVLSNIESLSMKISNNSELYVGNLEHSKIVNDIANSLEDVKSNIETIETYYMNDVNKQFSELTKIHRDLSKQIDGVKQDLETRLGGLDKVNDSLVTGFGKQDDYVLQIGEVMNGITEILGDIKSDESVNSVIEKVDEVTVALAEMRTMLVTSAETSVESLHSLEKTLSDNIDKTLHRFGEDILGQQSKHYDELLQSIDNLTSLSSTSMGTNAENEASRNENTKNYLADDLTSKLQKFEDNIQTSLRKSHEAILEKMNEKVVLPPETVETSESVESCIGTDVATNTDSFPLEIVDETTTESVTAPPQAEPETSVSQKISSFLRVEEVDPTSNLPEPILTEEDIEALKTFETLNLESDIPETLATKEEESSSAIEDLVSSVIEELSSANDDGHHEPVLYPGVVDDSNSSVYLYSALVTVSTVLLYFLK